MPFYEYQCCVCGHAGERLIVNKNGYKCQKCDGMIEVTGSCESPFEAKKVQVMGEFKEHIDPTLGHVSSRRQRQQLIRANGLIELGGENPEHTTRIADQKKEEALQRDCAPTVDKMEKAFVQCEQDVPIGQVLAELKDA